MPERLSIEDAQRLFGQEAEEPPAPIEIDGISPADMQRLFTPKDEQVRRMKHDLRAGNEWTFGVRAFDEATLGGARPGQLVTLIGKSHTGKSLLAMNMIARNRNHRTLWVSPDETEPMFWGKYAAIRLEIDQKDWVHRLIREDPTAWERVSEIMRNENNLQIEST